MTAISMTGFGKGELSSEKFGLTVEIKSVNHRFRDMRFRMPQVFNSKELELRKAIEKTFKRGSFDIAINYKKNVKKADDFLADLDTQKIEAFLSFIQTLSQKQKLTTNISASDFLRNEFLKNQSEDQEEELSDLLLPAFEKALSELQRVRLQEGKSLLIVIENHIKEFEKSLIIVKKYASEYEIQIKEKLKKRVNDFANEVVVDNHRLMQEVIFYLEKIDIQEEINRLQIHLEKTKVLLHKSVEIGRELDFTLQELNRETNTIASKSASTNISEAIIDMKLQLEKIREQALNLE